MFDVCKNVFYVAWLVILSILILFGVVFFAPFVFLIFKEFFPSMGYSLAAIGPWSVASWLILFVLLLNFIWPAVLLAVWTVKDAIKLKKRGIKIRPLFWFIGVILPTMAIAFPVYFVLRGTVWLDEAERENKRSKKSEKKMVFKAVILILVVLGVFFLIKIFYKIGVKETEKQVEKIHNTKLTMDDVMGKNLPPDPGLEADKTIAGVDANENGIRDDVELAIFKAYPNSAKTRAALLQYALALQMEAVQEVVNRDTVTEVATEQGRSDTCLADTLVPRKTPESARDDVEMREIDIFINFIENKQFNTEQRKNAQKNFYKGNLGSYGESTNKICDIDYSLLPN